MCAGCLWEHPDLLRKHKQHHGSGAARSLGARRASCGQPGASPALACLFASHPSLNCIKAWKNKKMEPTPAVCAGCLRQPPDLLRRHERHHGSGVAGSRLPGPCRAAGGQPGASPAFEEKLAQLQQGPGEAGASRASGVRHLCPRLLPRYVLNLCEGWLLLGL